MVYFIDYRGQIDPARTTQEHIGHRCIVWGDRILRLRPGLQQISDDLWHAVRWNKAIGWTQSGTFAVDAKIYDTPETAQARKADRTGKKGDAMTCIGVISFMGRKFARLADNALVLLDEVKLGEGKYDGVLVKRGNVRIFESKDGTIDWSQFGYGLADLAQRTTVVDLLTPMLEYAERNNEALLAERLKVHLADVSTDWHGKPVAREKLVPMMEVM